VYREESVDKAPTYTGREFVNVDTQFQIVDAALFEQLVDLKDRLAVPGAAEEDAALMAGGGGGSSSSGGGGGDGPCSKNANSSNKSQDENDSLTRSTFISRKSYAQLFADLRHCVDLCHRDGVIKDQVAKDPKR
jgi:hypothetical protein